MKKKIAIMQPYLFPYIGYFQLINAVDKFVIYDDVNFIKRGYINRNFILNGPGKFLFTFPIKKVSQNKLIRDLELSEHGNATEKYLKSLEQFYGSAPNFKKISKLIQEILDSKDSNLSKFIYVSLMKISDYIGIKTELIESSSIYKNEALKGQDRIIDICKTEGANTYINPIGGIKLYSREVFTENGIEIKFLKPKKIRYKQFENEFVKELSIIDVLMFNDKRTIKKFLKEYDLL